MRSATRYDELERRRVSLQLRLDRYCAEIRGEPTPADECEIGRLRTDLEDLEARMDEIPEEDR